MKAEWMIAREPQDFTAAVFLFEEYASGLGIDISFQNFDRELKALPTMYGPPYGRLWLLSSGEDRVGCAGIRRFDQDSAELKRMYIRPAFRGKGYAREVLDAAIGFCGQAGYKSIYLDTLDTMLPALGLYESRGFVRTEAYYHNPQKNVVYMVRTSGKPDY